jgi:hypothetical protein
MATPAPDFVSTDLGRWHVRRTGTGPPVVLWHSLFVDMYRVAGPTPFVIKLLFDSLIGKRSIAAQPEHAATVMASFRDADRQGMYHAMRSMMLHRNGIEHLLGDLQVPLLVMSVRDDVTGWRPDEARRTCATIPNCRVEEVAGTGHVSPLLIERDRILGLLSELWSCSRDQRG